MPHSEYVRSRLERINAEAAAFAPIPPRPQRERRSPECTHGRKAEELAKLCGVSLRTARRWKAGTSRVPKAAAAILLGDLGRFSPAWGGWRIQGEEIVSPDGWRISRNDALAVPLLLGQISAYQAEMRRLREFLGLEDQPLPESVPVLMAGG